MAYDKIIVIRSRLDCCLNYVQNEAKTDLANAVDYICNPTKAGLQTAINCSLEHAFSQMQETKRRWDKTGGVLGYHIVHSYALGEVTAEQAHEGGVELAQRLFGERYEVIICTHTDRSHLHCHIYIPEQMGYLPKKQEDGTLKKETSPVPQEPFSPERSSGLTQGTISTNEKKQPVRGRLAAPDHHEFKYTSFS